VTLYATLQQYILLSHPQKMATTTALTPDEKYDLITKNLGEVLRAAELKKLCAEQGRVINCYWGEIDPLLFFGQPRMMAES